MINNNGNKETKIEKETKKYIIVNSKKINKEKYDLIHKHFNVDDENAVVNIHIDYDKFSDLFTDEYLSSGYLMNSSFEEKLTRILKMIPAPYKINLTINIEDYESHTKEECEEYYKDSLKFDYLSLNKKAKLYSKESFVLLILGIVFLIGNVIFLSFYNSDKINTMYFSQTLHDVISEILDIAAWVFVWEAVTLWFLERKKVLFGIDKLQEKITTISFSSKQK